MIRTFWKPLSTLGLLALFSALTACSGGMGGSAPPPPPPPAPVEDSGAEDTGGLGLEGSGVGGGGTGENSIGGLGSVSGKGGGTHDTDLPAKYSEARGIEMPAFPWPPAKPSALITTSLLPYYEDLAGPDYEPVLEWISSDMELALAQAGYDYSFYTVPGGFAIVARLERIDAAGKPFAEPDRFIAPAEDKAKTFSDFVSGLFFAPDGYYRLFVFVISDTPFEPGQDKMTADEGTALLEKGSTRLSRSIEDRPMTDDHELTTLIYEFSNRKEDGYTVLRPGNHSLVGHLTAAGVADSLPQVTYTKR